MKTFFPIQYRWKELSKEDQAPSSECSPPHPIKPTAEKYNGNSMVLEEQEPGDVDLFSPIQNDSDTNDDK